MIHDVVPLGGSDATLTCYVHGRAPKLANVGTRPAVLVLPGGGYEHCSDRESEPVALALAGAGYHTFVLRYSVADAGTWPNPLRDAETALAVIAGRAGEWGVDADRIAMLGFSAGGHLAASTALLGARRPAALLLGYAVTTTETLRLCHPGVRAAPDLLAAVDGSCPPAFIFHTCDDDVAPVTDSLSLAERLAAARVPFELHVFPTGVHGLSLATGLTSTGRPEMVNPSVARWLGLAVDWLHARLPVG
ncbi:alpha/beta hydrolase [uncultured Propionibacterium sp.]|uniref:alpha/beta hydrolase n=1 Tax=uncultured Propionibacterium sp. TaxID=218066 RepID=UPI00292E9B54|nr:alpha/beta hydrolase [uncultured Propionibacterium sp.]